MTQGTRERLGVFTLIGQGFSLYIANFGRFFAYAFPAGLVSAALTQFTMGTFGMPAVDPAASPASFLPLEQLLSFAAIILVYYLAVAMISLMAIDAKLGFFHRASQYISQTLRHILPIVILSFLYSAAVFVGTLLFVIPGIYLAAKYYTYAQATLFEDVGWSGLGRASDLTRGYRWPVAGFLGIIAVLTSVVSIVVVEGLATRFGAGVAFLLDALNQTIWIGLSACLSAVCYLRLRRLNDGMTIDQIAATVS